MPKKSTPTTSFSLPIEPLNYIPDYGKKSTVQRFVEKPKKLTIAEEGELSCLFVVTLSVFITAFLEGFDPVGGCIYLKG